MKKNYVKPYLTETTVFMHNPILTGGSIEKMEYGESNVFESETPSAVKEREDGGCGPQGFDSLW